MADIKYKRVLLKLSGEALAGEKGFGIDPETVKKLLKSSKKYMLLVQKSPSFVAAETSGAA